MLLAISIGHLAAVIACSIIAFVLTVLSFFIFIFGAESMESLQADFHRRHQETTLGLVLLAIAGGLGIGAYAFS